MQRHTASALSLTLVLAIVLTAVGTATSEAGQAAAPEAPLTGAPTVVSYQGQVTVGGAPYTGDGYFKLAVVGPGRRHLLLVQRRRLDRRRTAHQRRQARCEQRPVQCPAG